MPCRSFDFGSLLRRAVTASQRNYCRAQHLAFAQDDGLEGTLRKSLFALAGHPQTLFLLIKISVSTMIPTPKVAAVMRIIPIIRRRCFFSNGSLRDPE